MKKLLPIFAVLLSFGACINDQENLQNIHDRDLEQIAAFLRDTDIQSVRIEQDVDTGIAIIWREESEEGRRPIQGDSVYVDYVGRFLDGRVFDTSIEAVAREHSIYDQRRNYKPLDIEFLIHPENKLIDGFEFALTQMKEGDQTVVLIPSTFAYGRRSSGSIPPNTPLRFDLDLIEVVEKEAEQI